MTRYFLDTEFIEDGKTIDLISIGIVCEDWRELYYVNKECDFSKASDWVKHNVLNQLPRRGGMNSYPSSMVWVTREEIRKEILWFVDPKRYGKPEFWGYYADYDWVAFCQLFGTMMDLPEGFPMYCHDIKQWCDQLGNPKLPKQDKGEHHALLDARWNQRAWELLRDLEAQKR